MVVDERRQQVLEEVVDQRRVVARDVAVAEVVAHHRGVFALHQRVVVAVSWAGFGELLDVQIVQQFGDLSIDVLRAIVRVEAIDYKGKYCDQAAQGRHHETLGYRLYGGHELVLGDRINDVDLVEALGAVQVALVNRINSQETGASPRGGACAARRWPLPLAGFWLSDCSAAGRYRTAAAGTDDHATSRPVARNGGPQRPRIAAA